MAVVPEAAMLTQQQFLLRENADLRQRIDNLQTRLDDKDVNQEKLLHELADLRERIGATESKLGLWREGRLTVEDGAKRDGAMPSEARSISFWERLFGRRG